VRDLTLALPGLFQPANALLAVGAVRALAEATGLAVPEAAVRAGAAGVRWPGRFQVVDGAHNPIGAAALAASLRHYFPDAPLTLVLGISADKDRAGILKALAPLAARLYLTAARNPRATPPAELLAELPPIEADVVLASDAAEALDGATHAAGPGVVCVAGSLFLVADALRWLRDRGLAHEP
jgi:dihydrofolate synthase/folylpolyglutamate synthase